MELFENERLYDDDDVELDVLGTRQKRARWRHEHRGPSYIKFGRRVKYAGSDLNTWLLKNRITTEGQ